eukprot:403372821
MNVAESKNVPLDDVAIYKYSHINLIFNKNEFPSEVKDEDTVILTLNSKKELVRTFKNGTQKVIAFNLSRTGYAKIALLVEMPNESDIPQYEKSDYQQNQLDITTNPQSRVGYKGGFSGTNKENSSIDNSSLTPTPPNDQNKYKESSFKKNNQDKNQEKKQNSMNGGSAKQYTIEEVRQHNTKESAWSIINGVVYDFTKFLNSHPGGFNNIFRAIGRDGTQVFSDGHSYVNNSKSFLARFEIGTLNR